MNRFTVCVRPKFNATFCYLGQHGLVSWDKDAERFESIKAANEEIKVHGWTNSTSQLPRMTTAYVVESPK
jgi:hypothetical protein